MFEHVYVCLICGRIDAIKIEKCPFCDSKNIAPVELSKLYGGG